MHCHIKTWMFTLSIKQHREYLVVRVERRSTPGDLRRSNDRNFRPGTEDEIFLVSRCLHKSCSIPPTLSSPEVRLWLLSTNGSGQKFTFSVSYLKHLALRPQPPTRSQLQSHKMHPLSQRKPSGLQGNIFGVTLITPEFLGVQCFKEFNRRLPGRAC